MPINYRKIHDFVGGTTEGASPFGSLVQMPSTNFLYGTSYDGGLNNIDQGTIYRQGMSLLTSPIGPFNTTYNFDDVSAPAYTDHGLKPQGTLLAVPPNLLYGTTTDGGYSDYYNKLGQGVLFVYNTTTSTYTPLHSFNGVFTSNDGAVPRSGVIKLSNNKLYGTTANGGSSFLGTIYSYDLGSNIYGGVLHNFAGTPTDGARPFGELVEDSNNPGTLYGMTREGGTNNVGTVYRYVVSTNTYTKLYDFTYSSTGAFPEYCQLIQSGNIFYGVTTTGGTHNRGTIFSFQPPTNLTPLWSFPNLTDGASPNGTLVLVNGVLYGITTLGGAHNQGVIYGYTLSNATYEVLHDFGTGLYDGLYPAGGLTYDSTNQVFYGTTVYGGNGTTINRNGTIFQFEISGPPPPPPPPPLPCVCYRIIVNTGGGSVSGTTCDGITGNRTIANPGLYHFCYEEILSANNVIYTATTYPCTNNQCSPPPYTNQCQLIFAVIPQGATYIEVYYISPDPLYYGSSLQIAIPAATISTSGKYCYMTRTDTILYAFDTLNHRIDIWNLTSGPTLIGNLPVPSTVNLAGIFYAGTGPKFYINNADTNQVELWDFTNPTSPTIQTVFALPSPYDFNSIVCGANNLYVDINNNIFYIALNTGTFLNPTIEFISLDSSGNVINHDFINDMIINMYIYNGNLYTIDKNNDSYLTTPSNTGGWTFTLAGHIPSPQPVMGGMAQWYNGTCIEQPPIGCVLTGLTISGCPNFNIEAHTGRTCYDGGIISVTVSGGCPDYIYTLYSPDPNTIIDQVTASTTTWVFDGIFNTGVYYVSVTSCSGDTLLTYNPFIINADDVAPFFAHVRAFIKGFCVTISGGTPPYLVTQDGNPLLWIDNNGIGITTNCYSADCNTQSVIIVEDSSNI